MKLPSNENIFYVVVDSKRDQMIVNKFCEQHNYKQKNTGKLNLVKLERVGYLSDEFARDVKVNKISLGLEIFK